MPFGIVVNGGCVDSAFIQMVELIVCKHAIYDPNIPIDNNAAERAVLSVTIERKNCLFLYRCSRGREELGHPLHDDRGMQAVQGRWPCIAAGPSPQPLRRLS